MKCYTLSSVLFKKHLTAYAKYSKFGNIYALLRSFQNSETVSWGVSEIRKQLCNFWGCPKFGNIFEIFGVYEIWKLFFSLLGCFQISGETIDSSSAIFYFRVIKEFLLLVFILNLRLCENKKKSIFCKSGVLEIRTKFTFNFLPTFNLFRKKNMILPCLNQFVGQRLPIFPRKKKPFSSRFVVFVLN